MATTYTPRTDVVGVASEENDEGMNVENNDALLGNCQQAPCAVCAAQAIEGGGKGMQKAKGFMAGNVEKDGEVDEESGRKEAVAAQVAAAAPLEEGAKRRALHEVVQAIAEELSEGPAKDLKKRAKILDILKSYDASIQDWRRYEFWDGRKYTRNLVATDNKTFTLMILCWSKEQKSPVHSHPCDGCFMRCIEGKLTETQYVMKEGGKKQEMIVSKETNVEAGQVVFINDYVGYHKISNPSKDEGAVTLHLYSPPFKTCDVWLDEKDVGNVINPVCTYYSVDGEKITYD